MQHSFSLHSKSVRVSVTHGGKQYRKATGLVVSDISLWHSSAKSLRAKCKDNRILAALLTIHSRLCEKEETARTEDDVLAAIEYALDCDIVRRKAVRVHVTERVGTPSLWQYLDEWAARPSSSKRQRGLVLKVVGDIMGRRDNWDDIDYAWWVRLNSAMESRGYSVNYRWNIGSRFKCVMHEGYTMKYHRNDDFRDFKLHKERTNAVALTPEEIGRLWDYEPKGNLDAKVRDLALIGYYTASRFSDYSRLTMDNIRDGRVEFTQQKTRDAVVIPASPKLIELLERNGGRAPKVCQQNFNREIKKIAKAIGVAGTIEIRGQRVPRWSAVQSHTLRRSAITALYLSGVSTKDCMAASGHKHMTSFELYVKVGTEDSVERLAKSAFFS